MFGHGPRANNSSTGGEDASGTVRCGVVREKTLRAFFDGGTDAQALDREAVESIWQPDVAGYWIEDMREDMGDFEVTREMVLKLCDAFLSGALGPRGLQAVGFMMSG